MLKACQKVNELSGCDPSHIPDSVYQAKQPVILRQLVVDWPIVKAGIQSNDDADQYLRRFYSGRPVTYYYGDPAINGRVFYNSDFTGFNFQRSEANLNSVLNLLKQHQKDEAPPMFYVGSTLVDNWLPGFRDHNDINIVAANPLVSVWLGNRSSIAAHFDFPDNIACNVVGKRTFTLFPPEQLENLYIGPLDITPSGRSISMADLNDPDFEKYPKFKLALEAAQVAELEPGDAIFIPSMWWHHVQAKTSLNILVNYWWRNTPAYMGNPDNVLHHALLSLRGLPKDQRDIWRRIFDHYIFEGTDEAVEHIPKQIRGILSPTDELIAHKIRSRLVNILKG